MYNGEPTTNRVQSSLLELPRCEGGQDCEAGLKKKVLMQKVRSAVLFCLKVAHRKHGMRQKFAPLVVF